MFAAPLEVINVDGDVVATQERETVDPSHSAGGEEEEAPMDNVMPDASESRMDQANPTEADLEPTGPSASTQAGAGLEIVVPQPPPASATAPALGSFFNLQRVPEDQVAASKEAMIQMVLMNQRLKEAYDASEALKTNVQVSAIVSL